MHMPLALTHPSPLPALLGRRGLPTNRIAFIVALYTPDASPLPPAVGRRVQLLDSFRPFVSCSSQTEQHHTPLVHSLWFPSRGGEEKGNRSGSMHPFGGLNRRRDTTTAWRVLRTHRRGTMDLPHPPMQLPWNDPCNVRRAEREMGATWWKLASDTAVEEITERRSSSECILLSWDVLSACKETLG